MFFTVTIIRNNEEASSGVSLKHLKEFIRLYKSQGYKTDTNGHHNKFIVESRIAGLLPFVKNTASDYDTFAVRIKFLK